MAPSPAKMVAEILRSSLSAFIQRSFYELNPATRYYHNWHIELLAAKLEEVRLGKCRRLIVNIPPRHLKSHAVSIAFPAWLLGHEPSKQVLSVTYAQDLSDNLARHCRTLMSSPFYRSLFKTRLSRGRETVNDYETTEGGYRLSTSVAGVLTGRGADIIIIDDPLKADDALSDTRRKAVNAWYDNTLRSRLNNQETGAIIIVMQRLHADDLVAHVQEHEHWDVLSLPAIAEQDEVYEFETPYGHNIYRRKTGEILQPSLISEATLVSHRQAMTDYNFSAQYQQNPQPESGLIIQRDWLQFYDDKDKPKPFEIVLQSWDTAIKSTELSDFSVCTTWGIKQGKFYLLDVFRKKLDFPELKKAVKQLVRQFSAHTVLIEDKASGSSLIQELRSERYSMIQAAPNLDGDKVMRLRAQTAKFEGRFVLLPKEAPWLDQYVAELISFPNSRHDDQVDSTVFALAWATLNPRWKGWTAESVQGLENLTSALMFDRLFWER
jgi:predicted phage terminase large subunit-like protein